MARRPRRYAQKKRYRTLNTRVLTKKVAKLSKAVRQAKPEVKYSYLELAGQQFNYSPTSSYVADPFSAITYGTGDKNSRIGDTIFVKSLKIKGTIYTSSASQTMLRIMAILVPKNLEGLVTTTNVGNMILDSDFSVTGNIVNAPLDNDNRFGVKILADRRININPISVGNAATAMQQCRPISVNLKLDKEVEYFHGGTTITKNQLFILFMSDIAASSSTTIYGVGKLTYTDV